MTPSMLVVEDEPAILELLKVNLVDAGYDVREARRRRDRAARSSRTRCPTSLLLDWMLPGQSGLALAQAAARRAAHARAADHHGHRAHATRPIASRASRRGSTTTSPSRSRRASSRRASSRCCAGARPRRRRRRSRVGPLTLDPVTHRVTVERRRRARWAPPSSGCCASCSRGRARALARAAARPGVGRPRLHRGAHGRRAHPAAARRARAVRRSTR